MRCPESVFELSFQSVKSVSQKQRIKQVKFCVKKIHLSSLPNFHLPVRKKHESTLPEKRMEVLCEMNKSLIATSYYQNQAILAKMKASGRRQT